MKTQITKSLRACLAVALLLLAGLTAQAQLSTPMSNYVVTNSMTTNFSSTLGNTVAIDCSGQRNVAIKWTLTLGGAGTEVHGVRFLPSVDGTVPSSPTLATGYSMAIAANGTTPVTVQTNFDVLGYRYLLISYLTNGTAQPATNTISYYIKRNAP